jgi:REP element-mobilizing transposase RayT
MPQSFAAIYLHLVFSTKNREPRIERDLQPRLFAYLGGIANNHDCLLLAAGGMPDHVHLLLSIARTMSTAEINRLLKSNSSSWLRTEMGRPDIRWQDGYGAFSVSQSNLQGVGSYLAEQEEHHRKLSFQEEFRELLRRHQIAWDEKYVWG